MTAAQIVDPSVEIQVDVHSSVQLECHVDAAFNEATISFGEHGLTLMLKREVLEQMARISSRALAELDIRNERGGAVGAA